MYKNFTNRNNINKKLNNSASGSYSINNANNIKSITNERTVSDRNQYNKNVFLKKIQINGMVRNKSEILSANLKNKSTIMNKK